MFCKYCGKEIDENAAFCPFCGAEQRDESAGQEEQPRQAPPYGQPHYPPYQQPYRDPADARSGGFAFLCFLFPVIGLILYLVWKDTMPLRAKSCGKGALIGVIVYAVFLILCIILCVVAFNFYDDYYYDYYYTYARILLS